MGFKKEEKKIEVLIPPEELEKGEEEKVEENEDSEVEEVEELNVEDSERELSKKVDEKREEFNKFAKKQKIYNYIATGILLVVLIVAFVIALTVGNQEGQSWVTLLVLGIAVVLLVASFVFTRLQRKKMEKIGNEYVQFVLTETNKEIYRGERFTDLNFALSNDEKESFNESRIFLNIKSFKAINVTTGKVNGNPFKVFDCAASVLIKNRPQPHFLGRMYVFDLKDVDPSLRAIFQIKGGEYSYPVDDIEDLQLIEGNNKYSFYISDEKVKTIFDGKVLSLIKKFKVDKNIIDVIVSLNNSKLFIGIDYADEFINVPTKESINLKNISKSKLDLEKVIAIREAIK